MQSVKSFVETINSTEVEKDEEHFSLDVTSLFTNVPILETIDIIADRTQKNTSWKTVIDIDHSTLMDFIRMCH